MREPQILVVERYTERRRPLLEKRLWRLGHTGCIGVCEMEGYSKLREQNVKDLGVGKS